MNLRHRRERGMVLSTAGDSPLRVTVGAVPAMRLTPDGLLLSLEVALLVFEPALSVARVTCFQRVVPSSKAHLLRNRH